MSIGIAHGRIVALTSANLFIRIFWGPDLLAFSRSTLLPEGAAPKSQKVGGDRRDRTDDLMLAKHALSQLSYVPDLRAKAIRRSASQIGGPGTTRTSDLTLIRGAL